MKYFLVAVVFFCAVSAIRASDEEDLDDWCDSREDGNYVNPNDKGSYIACSNGHTYVMPCPDGLEFNPDEGEPWGWCDWPESSSSSSSSESGDDSSSSSESGDDDDEGDDDEDEEEEEEEGDEDEGKRKKRSVHTPQIPQDYKKIHLPKVHPKLTLRKK